MRSLAAADGVVVVMIGNGAHILFSESVRLPRYVCTMAIGDAYQLICVLASLIHFYTQYNTISFGSLFTIILARILLMRCKISNKKLPWIL